MNITPDCISCIFNQALRVTSKLDLDDNKSKEVLDIASSFIPKFKMTQNPPEAVTPMYQAIAKHLNISDIYKDIKDKSTKEAQKLIPFCNKLLDNSQNKFQDATKLAVAGNVIDLASQVEFNLEDEVQNIINKDWAIDDTEYLYNSLKSSKNLVYLGDNVGEHIFDKLYIKVIKNIFPTLNIYYFTRGEPIINDVTTQYAYDADINKYAKIIDSGVDTPGIVIDKLNLEAKEIFNSADTIISKGMGNYECLNLEDTYPIYFLLKIKCSVVANSIGKDLGGIIIKRVRE